jgi:hypothetical protein
MTSNTGQLFLLAGLAGLAGNAYLYRYMKHDYSFLSLRANSSTRSSKGIRAILVAGTLFVLERPNNSVIGTS